MDRTIISTDRAPQAIGPYSQAVVAKGLVATAGQIALDPQSGQMVGEGDVARETEQVLRNLRQILEAAGSGMECVMRCEVYLADLDDYATVNEIYGRHFADSPPARVAIQAVRLPADARVEISALAVQR